MNNLGKNAKRGLSEEDLIPGVKTKRMRLVSDDVVPTAYSGEVVMYSTDGALFSVDPAGTVTAWTKPVLPIDYQSYTDEAAQTITADIIAKTDEAVVESKTYTESTTQAIANELLNNTETKVGDLKIYTDSSFVVINQSISTLRSDAEELKTDTTALVASTAITTLNTANESTDALRTDTSNAFGLVATPADLDIMKIRFDQEIAVQASNNAADLVPRGTTERITQGFDVANVFQWDFPEGSLVPLAAFDGDPSTAWRSEENSYSFLNGAAIRNRFQVSPGVAVAGDWITLESDIEFAVDQVVVRTGNNGVFSGSPWSWSVYTSDDGANWTFRGNYRFILDASTLGLGDMILNIQPVRARHMAWVCHRIATSSHRMRVPQLIISGATLTEQLPTAERFTSVPRELEVGGGVTIDGLLVVQGVNVDTSLDLFASQQDRSASTRIMEPNEGAWTTIDNANITFGGIDNLTVLLSNQAVVSETVAGQFGLTVQMPGLYRISFKISLQPQTAMTFDLEVRRSNGVSVCVHYAKLQAGVQQTIECEGLYRATESIETFRPWFRCFSTSSRFVEIANMHFQVSRLRNSV